MRSIITCLLFLCAVLVSVAQDTIKLGPSVHYSRKTDSIRDKWFYSAIKFAPENIVFSDGSKRVDYCYYDDYERICYGALYSIANDSTLAISVDGETHDLWFYRRNGNMYFVKKCDSVTCTFGHINNLMPFDSNCILITTTLDGKDTLWMTDGVNYRPGFYHRDYGYRPYHNVVRGKVYKLKKLEQAPQFLNGDSLPEKIRVRRTYFYYGEPYIHWSKVSFTITATGRLMNFETPFISSPIHDCQDYLFDGVRWLLRNPIVKPGIRKGKPVNVKWTVTVLYID